MVGSWIPVIWHPDRIWRMVYHLSPETGKRTETSGTAFPKDLSGTVYKKQQLEYAGVFNKNGCAERLKDRPRSNNVLDRSMANQFRTASAGYKSHRQQQCTGAERIPESERLCIIITKNLFPYSGFTGNPYFFPIQAVKAAGFPESFLL